MLAFVDRLGATLDRLFTLHEARFEGGDLLAAFLGLGLGVGTELEDLVLRLENGFLAKRLGLLLGVSDDASG